MSKLKNREEQYIDRAINRMVGIFTDSINILTKQKPIEGDFRDPGKIFFCEVRNFKSEKEKIEYMNQPDKYPIHLCHDTFQHSSFDFYKKVFVNTHKFIPILKAQKKNIEYEHIHDSITWGSNSLFEIVLFHGSKKYIHYFDEDFFMKQFINLLLELHGGRFPHQRAMKMFSLCETDGIKTLTIKI